MMCIFSMVHPCKKNVTHEYYDINNNNFIFSATIHAANAEATTTTATANQHVV